MKLVEQPFTIILDHYGCRLEIFYMDLTKQNYKFELLMCDHYTSSFRLIFLI